MEELFDNIIGFEWDSGNKFKSFLKHNVSNKEAEEIFFNKPLIIADDVKHSELEKRWFALGKTNNDKKLMVVFTIRENNIRVITARIQSKNERKHYNEANTKI